MKNYRPKIISIDPLEILPFHHPGELRQGIIMDYLAGVYVPPIPVLHASQGLENFGRYVNYNGHHRTFAAREVKRINIDFQVSAIQIECDLDIEYLKKHPPRYNLEVYPELIEDLGKRFELHRDHVFEEAKRFQKLLERAKEKNIPWGYTN